MKKNNVILTIASLFAFMGCIGLGIDDYHEIASPLHIKLINNSPKDVNVVFHASFSAYTTTEGGILAANSTKDYVLDLDKFWRENKELSGRESYEASLTVIIDNKTRSARLIDVNGLGKYSASAGNSEGTITGTTTDGAVTVKWK